MASNGFSCIRPMRASPSTSRVRRTRRSNLRDAALGGDAGVFLGAFLDIRCLFVQLLCIFFARTLTVPRFLSTVRCMTDDRISGLALIAGSAGVILALGLHPSGRDLFAAETFEIGRAHV